MPRFIDRHEQFPKPDAAGLAAMRAQVEAPTDAFGVKGVNILFGSDGGAYCLMDAPNADAVVQAHARNGVPLTRAQVTEITTLV
ncbi:MAG: nickel-binding protein [Dehalococcoidia bacterium]